MNIKQIKDDKPDGATQAIHPRGLDNTDLLNEVKFYNSRKKYRELMKGSKFSKLKPL